MKTVRLLLVAALLPAMAAADLTGRVVAVGAGDSLTVLVNERDQMKVRLLGVDAPETYQDLAKQSQSSLAAYTVGKEVRIEGEKKDPRGSTLAQVWVADDACRQAGCPKTINVGLAQVAAGMAWHDRQYEKELSTADQQRYTEAEFMAKIRRLGVWGIKKPKSPWASQQHRLDE